MPPAFFSLAEVAAPPPIRMGCMARNAFAHRNSVAVPILMPEAREPILRIALFGATGNVDFDKLEIKKLAP